MSARSIVIVALLALAGCPPRGDSQRLPIGVACNTSGQCGTGKFFCDLAHANGYCKASCGSDADCPQGSICVAAACEKSCATVDDCRAGDLCLAPGYCDQPPVLDLGASD